jgi:hypothetical protein
MTDADLHAEIREHLRAAPPVAGPGDDPDDGRFDELAVRLGRWQHATNAAYRRWVDATAEVPPDGWRTWRDVTPMPVTGFKAADVRSGDAGEPPAAVWSSSDTSGTGTSRTPLTTLEFYDLVVDRLAGWFVPDAGPSPAAVLRLVPDGGAWPHSSLAHMYDRMGLGRRVVSGVRDVTPSRYALDEEVVLATLADHERSQEQLVVLSTSYALVQLLDLLELRGASFGLSGSSCVVDTGGYKGITREVPRPEVIALVGRVLGLSPGRCVGEYGMSELSSQWWTPNFRLRCDAGGAEPPAWTAGVYASPSWTRRRVLDPLTLEPADGTTGQLAVFDLANVWSCASILTQDVAELPDAAHLVPRGRIRGADLKGCSLTAERAMRGAV